MRPKIGLALGSGGLKGMAHVGVLKVLEKENVPIDCISGCSIGSLVGALYCSGHNSATITQLAKHLKRRHWLDFIVPKMGLFSGERVLETMELLTQRRSFEELNIPLAIVATDLKKGESIVMKTGSVSKAVRASVSVPGIFVPFRLNNKLLVDGAVLDPTPIDAAFGLGADIVIAVDLSRGNMEFEPQNIFDVIIKSIDVMENALLKKMRSRKNMLLLRPEVADISPSSFSHIDETIALGEVCCKKMMPKLKSMLKRYEQSEKSGENG